MQLTREIIGEGLVSLYLEYIGPHEAPESMHLASLLTLFSAAVERRLVIRRGYTIRANLYTLLVGPPATRKTFAMRIAKGIFEEAGTTTPVLGENVTDEGVLTRFERMEKNNESPAALAYAEEFGVLLGEDKKYKEGVLRFLIRAYDGGSIRTERRGERGEGASYGASDVFLCLLAGTTPADMRELPTSTLRTGLTSRTWVIAESGPKAPNWRPNFDRQLRDRVVELLAERMERMREFDLLAYDPGVEADKYFEAWYCGDHWQDLKHQTEATGHWFGRRHDHAMRAAVLLYLLDGGDPNRPMSVEDAQRGISYVKAMEPGMFKAFGDVLQTQWSSKKQMILDRLLTHDGKMGVRQLKCAVGARMQKGEADALLLEMKAEGVIEIVGSDLVVQPQYRG